MEPSHDEQLPAADPAVLACLTEYEWSALADIIPDADLTRAYGPNVLWNVAPFLRRIAPLALDVAYREGVQKELAAVSVKHSDAVGLRVIDAVPVINPAKSDDVPPPESMARLTDTP